MLFNSFDKQSDPGVRPLSSQYYSALQSAALFHLQMQQQNHEYLSQMRQAEPAFLSELLYNRFQAAPHKESKCDHEPEQTRTAKRPLLKFSMDAILGHSPQKRQCIRDTEDKSVTRIHHQFFNRPIINATLDPSFKQPKLDQINYPISGKLR